MLFESVWWKRVVVILFTIPVTIFMNALRIVLVGVTVDRWGIKMAGGVMHDFEGWVVFVGCIGCLFLLHSGLSLIRCEPPPAPKAGSEPRRLPCPPMRRPLALVIAVFLISIAGQNLLRPAQQDASVPRQTFALFPLKINQWSGHTQDLPTGQAQTLKLSDYFLADYSATDSPAAVNLYIAYYASQRRDAAPHSPLVCISGSGWEITSLSSDFVVRDPQGRALAHVNRALIKNGAASELVYYWFSERGRDLTSATQRKWFLIKDALTKHRTDGALIRMATPLSPSEQEADADRRLAAFMGDAIPLFHSFIPD
jgi:exosortase D (VPLPA-CTERM-specific)